MEERRESEPGNSESETDQAPDEVLELPHGTDAGDLEDEDTIVVEEIVDLLEEPAGRNKGRGAGRSSVGRCAYEAEVRSKATDDESGCRDGIAG